MWLTYSFCFLSVSFTSTRAPQKQVFLPVSLTVMLSLLRTVPGTYYAFLEIFVEWIHLTLTTEESIFHPLQNVPFDVKVLCTLLLGCHSVGERPSPSHWIDPLPARCSLCLFPHPPGEPSHLGVTCSWEFDSALLTLCSRVCFCFGSGLRFMSLLSRASVLLQFKGYHEVFCEIVSSRF